MKKRSHLLFLELAFFPLFLAAIANNPLYDLSSVTRHAVRSALLPAFVPLGSGDGEDFLARHAFKNGSVPGTHGVFASKGYFEMCVVWIG